MLGFARDAVNSDTENGIDILLPVSRRQGLNAGTADIARAAYLMVGE